MLTSIRPMPMGVGSDGHISFSSAFTYGWRPSPYAAVSSGCQELWMGHLNHLNSMIIFLLSDFAGCWEKRFLLLLLLLLLLLFRLVPEYFGVSASPSLWIYSKYTAENWGMFSFRKYHALRPTSLWLKRIDTLRPSNMDLPILCTRWQQDERTIKISFYQKWWTSS